MPASSSTRDRGAHALQCGAQDVGVGGEIDPDEAGAARPEDVTRADGDPRVVEEESGRTGQLADHSGSAGGRLVVEFQVSTVEPPELAGLGAQRGGGSKMPTDEVGQQGTVAVQAREQRIQPGTAEVEGRGVGEYAQVARPVADFLR